MSSIVRAVCLAAVVLAASGYVAAAYACNVQIPDTFRLRQNNGYTLKFTTMSTVPIVAKVKISGGTTGRAEGDGGANRYFHFTVYWKNNSVGVYQLYLSKSGYFTGESYDKNNPSSTTGVAGLTEMECN